jgi:hypothetical protein
VRTSVFSTLTADGRKTLSGLPITTVAGVMSAQVARTKTITVGGEAVLGSVVMSTDDSLLDGISDEVGHPIDGLLGGTFLREFFVTIDYPHRTLVLHRYADRSHIVDEFVSVGVDLAAATDGSYKVAAVFAATAADMAGVSDGDTVTAIDGMSLAGVDPLTVNTLLLGPLGSTHAVTFGATDVPLNTNKTLTLPVEDLVSSP